MMLHHHRWLAFLILIGSAVSSSYAFYLAATQHRSGFDLAATGGVVLFVMYFLLRDY